MADRAGDSHSIRRARNNALSTYTNSTRTFCPCQNKALHRQQASQGFFIVQPATCSTHACASWVWVVRAWVSLSRNC